MVVGKVGRGEPPRVKLLKPFAMDFHLDAFNSTTLEF